MEEHFYPKTQSHTHQVHDIIGFAQAIADLGGLTNPLTADLNADGHYINLASPGDNAQSIRYDPVSDGIEYNGWLGHTFKVNADGSTPLKVEQSLVTVTNLKVTGGTPGTGKVLTSDSDGDASWKNPSSATVYNVLEYGATGNGVTNDSAAIQSAINAASTNGGTVYLPSGNYKVSSTSRTDTVSFASGSTFNDTSITSGDIGKYVLWANLGRVAKITSVVAGVSFTVDVAPLTTSATSARIVSPGLVIPEGVFLRGAGASFNHQLATAGATSQVNTQITDAGTGVTILIRGANSPAGGSTRYGLSNMSVIGNSSNTYGLFVGNGAWMIDSDNLELSSHGIAGLGLDGNINSHNFHNAIFYGNGKATATTPTGGVITHPFNAAGSASCNFYNTFFSANIGFGICDGVDTGGAYGVNLWAPQFNSQQASLMANSGTSMVLQSKGTGDGMATVVGGWSETAALYDVITSGYVTIVSMRMHSSHAYHWIVNGGIANAIGCTFEGATSYTAQLNSSGVFNWNAITSVDPGLYSGGPSTVPASGSSSVMFANSLQSNGSTIIGDLLMKNAATAARAYRFRTSGASVDFDFAGNTLYLSGYPNADFTGTQQFYLGLDTSGNADAFGVWRFHTAPFATTKVTIDSGSATPIEINGGLRLDGSTSGSTVVQAPAVASGTLTLPAATDTLVGRATTDTLTNKSISFASNTVTTTLAQLNTAVTDADVVSLTGVETLTNKTLTAPVINNPTGFASGWAKLTVGTVAPASPTAGDLWVDTN